MNHERGAIEALRAERGRLKQQLADAADLDGASQAEVDGLLRAIGKVDRALHALAN